METRVAITCLYAIALGTVFALDNLVGVSDILELAVWLPAPAIGFLVGRWWAVLAVVGALIGRVIGWEPAENDGNPALWPPYLVSTILLVGAPLLLGVAISVARENARLRRHA